MLLLGGDYVTDSDSIDVLFKSLSVVRPCLGTYAVLGNHDMRNELLIRQALDEYGIEMLDGVSLWRLYDDGSASFLPQSRTYLGMSTLRDLIFKRPSRQFQYLHVLLDLSSHEKDKVTPHPCSVLGYTQPVLCPE